MSTISPRQLYDRHVRGESVELIDVRTPAEFREVHAEPAQNIPLDSIDSHISATLQNGSGEKPLYLICNSGNRSSKAHEAFRKSGFNNVVDVAGGTQAWEEAGLPVVRGKKAVSLERQVRIAAGFLVFVGALLAMFVHPWWAALPAFIGAGLMFAGITDTCGMALMLAKMPWNQVKEENEPACCSQ